MMPRLYPLPGNEAFTAKLAAELKAQTGLLMVRRFPDSEVLVRYDTPPENQIALVCTLARADMQILPLLFAAGAAHSQGAAGVGLVAPYLGYLRQDQVFNPGEALTSHTFAELLSGSFDWIVTVDPHLHRYTSLDEVYRIPAAAVSASSAVAAWIREQVFEPVVIGPDVESTQWASAIAAEAGAPYTTFLKHRFGDRSVVLTPPDLKRWAGRTPVLIDDIISSGRTMVEALRLLREAGFPAPACIATHAVFSDQAREELAKAGAARIVTTDTIVHPTNEISVVPAVARAVESLTAARLEGAAHSR